MRPRPFVKRRRRGNILVLTAMMMILMMALLAFALDWGYAMTVKTELQRAADAAALAAALELVDEDTLRNNMAIAGIIANARTQAVGFAASNPVASSNPTVDANAENDLEGMAISTSGNYERYVKSIKHNHLINPKSKRSQQDIASMTLYSKEYSNAILDALATALSVMPHDKRIELLSTLPTIAYIFVTTQNKTYKGN